MAIQETIIGLAKELPDFKYDPNLGSLMPIIFCIRRQASRSGAKHVPKIFHYLMKRVVGSTDPAGWAAHNDAHSLAAGNP